MTQAAITLQLDLRLKMTIDGDLTSPLIDIQTSVDRVAKGIVMDLQLFPLIGRFDLLLSVLYCVESYFHNKGQIYQLRSP